MVVSIPNVYKPFPQFNHEKVPHEQNEFHRLNVQRSSTITTYFICGIKSDTNQSGESLGIRQFILQKAKEKIQECYIQYLCVRVVLQRVTSHLGDIFYPHPYAYFYLNYFVILVTMNVFIIKFVKSLVQF